MIDNLKKSHLTKYQQDIISELVSIISMQIHEAFEKDMHFVFTVKHTGKNKGLCFTVSNFDRKYTLQAYVDDFCALKNDLSKDDKIGFTRKLLSNILETTEEKKECFYWLLDQLDEKDNIHGIKH